MLSDEDLRQKYDTLGDEGLENVPTMDSKAIFEMIFGSDKFEPLLGELQIAMMMNLSEGSPAELLQFKQKKREIQIAVNIV